MEKKKSVLCSHNTVSAAETDSRVGLHPSLDIACEEDDKRVLHDVSDLEARATGGTLDIEARKQQDPHARQHNKNIDLRGRANGANEENAPRFEMFFDGGCRNNGSATAVAGCGAAIYK